MKDYFYLQVGKNVRLVLPAELVVETIALNFTQICPIPGIPDMFLGAIDYQGELIWAIDLALYLSDLFGLAPVFSIGDYSLTKDKLTLVAIAPQPLNSQEQITSPPVAWVVSEVHGIVSLNPAKFRPIPAQFQSLLDPYLSGLTELDPTPEVSLPTVAILNVTRLFTALESQSQVHFTSAF